MRKKKKKKIVLIDDEPDILTTIQIFLESENYDVSTASDGMSGLELVKRIMPDLVVLDIMLPSMDGFNVCRMLKFDKNFMKIPIIMLTAKFQQQDKQLGKDVGADIYVTKPLELDVLLGKIRELIN